MLCHGRARLRRGAGSTAIFNRRLTDRQPAAVVRPQTEAEVVDAVRLARERGWQVAVRSGGHSWAQWSVRDDALVIDLGGLQELSYDEATGLVAASPAVKGGSELGAVPRGPRPVLPRRPLPDRRHRRLPAPGRPGLERARLGLGRGVRRGGRRGHRVRRARARLDRRERRPLLGRARSRPGLPRRRHPVPPAHAARSRGTSAQTVQAYSPRRLRRGDDLAARDPRHRSPTPSRSSR